MRLRGFKVAQLFGLEIRLDPSLLIIFALIVGSLGVGVLPAWHPDWTSTAHWAVATAAGALFLVSILLHEMAHALVAKAYGLPVRTITLFLFGGVTNIEEDPQRPGAEFVIAGVGPLTSLAIGAGCLVLAAALSGPVPSDAPPAAYAQQLGPVATLLAWLGPVNILLGLFNMLPGFPLDGGRMFRAALWKITGSLLTATRWASRAGVALGWTFVAVGVAMALGLSVPILGSGLVSGLWLAFIGWFLSRLASWGYQRTVVEHLLEDAQVDEVMAQDLLSVPPDLSLLAFAHDHLGRHDQLSWPVVRDEELVGVVRPEDIQRIPRDRWDRTPLSKVMIPAEGLPVAAPEDSANEAFKQLTASRWAHVSVRDHGRWIGLVRQPDILRWLQLHARGPAEI